MKRKWIIGLLLIVSMMLAFGSPRSTGPLYAEEGSSEDRPGLTISVVEEIPADDIEETRVPLGALPTSPDSEGVRHLIPALVLAVCAVVYVIYFFCLERRIFRLRRQAAEAESRAVRQWRDPS